MCSTHFTLSCRILLFSLPTTNNFLKFVYSEITGESAWQVPFRLPSLAIEGNQNLTHFDSGLLISRTFLPRAGSFCIILCLYLVSCTQKNMLKSTQFSRYHTTFIWPFYSFLQNWVITEVLVCLVYVLYEFIVLDSSIRLLLNSLCLQCCIMDRTYHSHKSCPTTLVPLRHHSSRNWLLIFQALAFPF